MTKIYQERIDAYKRAADKMAEAPAREAPHIQDREINTAQTAERPNTGKGNIPSLVSPEPWVDPSRIAQLRQAAAAAKKIDPSDTEALTLAYDHNTMNAEQRMAGNIQAAKLSLQTAQYDAQTALDFPLQGTEVPDMSSTQQQLDFPVGFPPNLG